MSHISQTVACRIFRMACVLVFAAVLAMLLAGCTLPGDEQTQQTVTDPDGLFHFKVPAPWQVNIEQGLIAVYASEELPESSVLEALSLVVLSATVDETTTPVAERVASIVDMRADSRGWHEYEVGEAEEVAVGARTGTRVEVSGIDAEGLAFEGAYHLVRTSGAEVLIVAVAPAGNWAEDGAVLADVFEQWYWLRPENGRETP